MPRTSKNKTIDHAFNSLMQDDNINYFTRSTWKSKVKQGKLSNGKKADLLEKHGWIVIIQCQKPRSIK
jgi:hypothetical protein